MKTTFVYCSIQLGLNVTIEKRLRPFQPKAEIASGHRLYNIQSAFVATKTFLHRKISYLVEGVSQISATIEKKDFKPIKSKDLGQNIKNLIFLNFNIIK